MGTTIASSEFNRDVSAVMERTTGGVGAFDGTFEGKPEIVLEPGEVGLIDVVLRADNPDDITVAHGLVIGGTRRDGSQVWAHTCWTLAVAPPEMDCSKPGGGEAFDADYDYMESVCSKP